jgi:hypothetical protein
MLRKFSTVIISGLLLAGLLPPAANAARADTKPPKVTKAQMLDRNGNGLADAVKLTYNEKIKHRLDTDGSYPFKVLGPTKASSYRIKKVNASRRSASLLIILKEKENGDATPDVKYVRTRKKPVRDLARNQAKRQIFIRTLGLPISADTFMLTMTPPENGTITSSPAGIDCGADCTEEYPAGSEVTLTATPDEGGEWGGWGGACSGTADTCTVTMDGDKTVEGTFAAAGERVLTVQNTGAGKVTSSPSGIDCGTTCTKTYPQDQEVTLTADPDLNSEFLGWTGAAGCTDTATCTVTMDASKTVEAEFTWVLTVIKTGPGSVSSLPAGMTCAADITTCAAGFAPGSNVVLSASPSGGSKFVGWSDACTGTTATAGCTVAMTQNRTVRAGFGFDLTVAKDQAGTGTGTVTSNSSPAQTQQLNCGNTCTVAFPANTLVTMTAAAANGSAFEGWSGGVCSGTTLTCQVTVDAAKTITAKFGLSSTTYALTITRSGDGLGTVTAQGINCDGLLATDCSESYQTGTVVQLTADPGAGSSFEGWSVDGVDCGTNSICNVTMTAAKNVTATFALDEPGPPTMHSFDASSNSGTLALLTPVDGLACAGATCSGSVASGTLVTLVASPTNPLATAVWSGCDSTLGNQCVVLVNGAEVVTATF